MLGSHCTARTRSPWPSNPRNGCCSCRTLLRMESRRPEVNHCAHGLQHTMRSYICSVSRDQEISLHSSLLSPSRERSGSRKDRVKSAVFKRRLTAAVPQFAPKAASVVPPDPRAARFTDSGSSVTFGRQLHLFMVAAQHKRNRVAMCPSLCDLLKS